MPNTDPTPAATDTPRATADVAVDLWEVDDARGVCVYRGPDLALADDLYGAIPGAHLLHVAHGPAAA
ncbi:MAG: hypothetical protein ACRCZP_11535 [Phycicoccus sp.]